MVPLVISHDGAIHKDTVRRWKDFAPDIRVDWVRMAQNVLRYNVVIVGKYFNKGSRMSEVWRKEHTEEMAEEPHGAGKPDGSRVLGGCLPAPDGLREN